MSRFKSPLTTAESDAPINLDDPNFMSKLVDELGKPADTSVNIVDPNPNRDVERPSVDTKAKNVLTNDPDFMKKLGEGSRLKELDGETLDEMVRRQTPKESTSGRINVSDANMQEDERFSSPSSKEAPKSWSFMKFVKAPEVQGYQRLALPSNFIFYNFDDLGMRKFNVEEAIEVTKASETENLSHLLDILDGTLTQDVRSLTLPDLMFVMYMQRFQSYTKTPFNVDWTSKYGNVNKTNITKTLIETTYLEKTKDDLQVYLDQGFVIPTMRDIEIPYVYNIDKRKDNFWKNAKAKWIRSMYMFGESPEEKVAHLEYRGPDIIGPMDDFANEFAIGYGVKESVKLRDQKYSPLIHLQNLTDAYESELKTYEAAKDTFGETNAVTLDALKDMMEAKLRQETLKAAIETGTKVQADEEEVVLTIGLFSFFPPF